MDLDAILADASRATEPQEAQDLQLLTRAWVAERCAPEVLPYPEDLMERVLRRIRKQIEYIEDQSTLSDPKTNFKLIIIQTELERFKYLIRSYLRSRLSKIDSHPHHHLSLPQSTNLSASETHYLRNHISLLERHYASSFLSQFPPRMQRLDDTAGGISMVEGPDLDKAVFVRVLRDLGVISVEGTDAVFEMRRGDVFVVRWRVVRDAVLRGDAEMI